MPVNPAMIPGGIFLPSQVEQVRSCLEELVAARRSKHPDPVAQLAPEQVEWIRRLVAKPTIVDAESALHAITTLSRQAPIFELGFASQPTEDLVKTVVDWLRGRVNPLILIRVTIQPGLIGGCTIRTARHAYDMSVAAAMPRGHEALKEVIHAW